MSNTPSMFPEYPDDPNEKPQLKWDFAAIKDAVLFDKPDNSPYLRAVEAARKGYAEAEIALGGPVYLHETRNEFDADGYRMVFVYRRKSHDERS